MDAAAQAAVGAGDDAFLADELSKRDESIGDQFRVLDEVVGVADNTGNQDLPGFTCANYGLPDMKVTSVPSQGVPEIFTT